MTTLGAWEIHPPRQIATARLVLRAWRPEDAPHLKHAIDSSLEHLRPWLPWAWDEPSPLEEIAARLARFTDNFATGKDWLYGIFTPDERTVIGGTGLHPRIGPGGVEIGYWIAVQQTHKGYATEVARALTMAAFALLEIERVEIRCDPRNVASANLPRQLIPAGRDSYCGQCHPGRQIKADQGVAADPRRVRCTGTLDYGDPTTQRRRFPVAARCEARRRC
jgi:RimJ/RimL family protein N-acetyltransferase